MKTPTLSRQLVRAMTGLAVLTTLFVVAGSYAFYDLMAKYLPETQPDAAADWTCTTPEAAWLAVTLLVAIGGSAVLATRLAQRILVPLNSVAQSLARLARGELSVRAQRAGPRRGRRHCPCARGTRGVPGLGRWRHGHRGDVAESCAWATAA